MISKIWQLSLNMLFVKKGRTTFSILAIALGVGLLCSMLQMHTMFNQALQHKLANESGSADIRGSSPPPINASKWTGLDTSILKELHILDQIQSVGQALEGNMAISILYENQQAIIGDREFHYVGVYNEKVTKAYYNCEQDL